MKFITILILCSILFSSAYAGKGYFMSLTTYKNRFKWPTKLTQTGANDWGNQATIYLDRHAVNCGIGALAQFHLRRPNIYQIRYDAMCIMPINCNRRCPQAVNRLDRRYCSYHNTPQNVLGNWVGLSTNYLDRHHVKCPRGKVLTYFVLKSNWNIRKIWYHYKCCPAATRNCRSYRTPLQSYGNMGNIFLDRQKVKVPNIRRQAMTGFRLLSVYNRQSFQYLVNYCDVTGR